MKNIFIVLFVVSGGCTAGYGYGYEYRYTVGRPTVVRHVAVHPYRDDTYAQPLPTVRPRAVQWIDHRHCH